MKTVVLKISLALVAALLLLKLLESALTFGLQHNCNAKIPYVYNHSVGAQILFLGPCQVEWIIQTPFIEKHTGLKTYNLGLTHADFAENYLTLYLYLKNNNAPKYLFLYVSPESMDLNYNLFNTYRFASMANDSIVEKVIKECDKPYAQWKDIPFMRYAYYSNNIYYEALEGFKHFMNEQQQPYYKDGFTPPLFLSKPDTNKYIEIYPEGFTFEWNITREKYLRKTIELALQNNIKVYLYESPIANTSIMRLKNRNECINKIKQLADSYKIQYIPFENMKFADSGKNFLSSVIPTIQASAEFSDTIGKYISTQLIKQ